MSDLRSSAKQLSPTEIKKAVLTTAIQRPLTVYSASTALLTSMYGLMFSFSPVVSGIVGVGLSISVLSGLVEVMFRGDIHTNKIMNRLRQDLSIKRKQSLLSLTQTLESNNHYKGLKQVELFRDKYENFVSILDQKLDPGELTYNRYLTIAEQVFLAGLDNLESSAMAIASIGAIDIDHINSELQRIQLLPNPSDFDLKNITLLNERQNLRNQQLIKSESLLQENENALTQLDHVTTRIANINTKQGRAQLDLENAMTELKELIDRADNYSN